MKTSNSKYSKTNVRKHGNIKAYLVYSVAQLQVFNDYV